MAIFIVICLFIVSAVICHMIAKHRGANKIFWGTMGGIFGPIAIPFVLFSKTHRSN